MTSDIPRPPYDAELTPVLAAIPLPQPLTLELVAQLQATPSLMMGPSVEQIIGDRLYRTLSVVLLASKPAI